MLCLLELKLNKNVLKSREIQLSKSKKTIACELNKSQKKQNLWTKLTLLCIHICEVNLSWILIMFALNLTNLQNFSFLLVCREKLNRLLVSVICVTVYGCVTCSWVGVCRLNFWLVQQSASVTRRTNLHRCVDMFHCWGPRNGVPFRCRPL